MNTDIPSAKTIIPENSRGKATDLEVNFTGNDMEEAKKTFQRAMMRLKNVAIWHKLCGDLSAEFILVGDDGDQAERLAKTGDYFLIDIPGPGMIEGDGYDWVKVLNIWEEASADGKDEMIAMKVGATTNPGKPGNETAHFFQEGATSTFIIQREYNKVTASYHGRNEVPNTDVKHLLDKIRNTVVAVGAYGGLSELQWKALLQSFLKEEL